SEASAVFNNMAVQRLTSEADTMLVAPLRFKSVLLSEMDRQIARAKEGKPASMILKNNSINDPDIINRISAASCAGVRVDMIVRGICCIRAGVPGKTENVHIRSLVGRYLEHSRIYCFGDGDDMRIYIASGDFLTRNTERRVEVGVRVDDPAIAKMLRRVLDLQLSDTVNAWQMQPDGSYLKVKPAPDEVPIDSQMAMYGCFQHNWVMQRDQTASPKTTRSTRTARPVVTQKPVYRPRPVAVNADRRPLLERLFGKAKK
ncbi:MAG: polyphosphate kinase 1, partial [Gemmiger sp.]